MTAGPNDASLSIFLPDFESMSAAEALAYIKRTRGQLERLARQQGPAGINPAEEAAIRRLCDELEVSIRSPD